MKRKSTRLIVLLILMIVTSCDEPETVVTNYVHTDGSVTRKIEMRSSKNKFEISDIQVPIDSTWSVKDTCEINRKGDTTWIRRAAKLFNSVDEINLSYRNDSGANREISRNAAFRKKFKWFNTEYSFSEKIDKKLSFGYPAKNFLNKEELLYFYSPDRMKAEKENGPDSLKFRALSESVRFNTDNWTYKNVVSMWISEFVRLTGKKSGSDLSMDSLKSHEDQFVALIRNNEKTFDSLWANGFFLKEFIGEANALKYKTEADSALSVVTRNYFINFKDYLVRIAMPGKLIGTNGFADSSELLLWPVKADYFLTEPYEMWALSRIPNRWAWIVSGLFLVFVLTGVTMRIIKRG